MPEDENGAPVHGHAEGGEVGTIAIEADNLRKHSEPPTAPDEPVQPTSSPQENKYDDANHKGFFRRLVTRDPLAASMPLSIDRLHLARSMIIQNKNNFCILVENPPQLKVEEPFLPLEEQRKYAEDLQRYFQFKIDYYPNYGRTIGPLLEFKGWTFFIDVHDETIEGKFPVDQDIRAYIHAFRITIERNFNRYVERKRMLQLAASIGFLVPALFVFGLQKFGIFSFDGASSLLLVAVTSVTLIWAILIIYGTTMINNTIRQFLGDNIGKNAGNLKAKVQRRMTMLMQGFNFAVQNVNDSELTGAAARDHDWTEDAKFWARLALWKPKRIEYIEKFYQSEMQRLRIFQKLIDSAGNASSVILPFLVTAIAAGLSYYIDPDFEQPVSALNITLTVSAVFSWIYRSYAAFSKFRVNIEDIKSWIGDNDWKRFSEISFDETYSDIIRRDKERIRQEKSRGGGLGNT